jgi:hypothetical protein
MFSKLGKRMSDIRCRMSGFCAMSNPSIDLYVARSAVGLTSCTSELILAQKPPDGLSRATVVEYMQQLADRKRIALWN